MKNLLVYVSLLATLALAGCATILDDSRQNVSITTSNGAAVTLKVTDSEGTKTITTPSSVNVKRSSDDLIILVQDKCYSGEYTAEKKINNWAFANLISGGTTGTSTDASTGALWAYDKNVVVPVIKKQGAGC